MSSDEDIFEAVLSEFKARLTKKELEDFGFASLEGVQSEIARIQKEQEMLKNMMDTSRLKLFLDAMNQFGKVIEVFLDASKFVPFIWGPMKFLLQVGQRPSLASPNFCRLCPACQWSWYSSEWLDLLIISLCLSLF